MSHISGLIGKLFYYYPDKLVNKLGHMYYQSQIKGKTDTLHLKGRIRIQWPNRLVVGDNCCWEIALQSQQAQQYWHVSTE